MPLSKLKLMALEIAGLAQKKGLPLSKSISDVVREEEQLFFFFLRGREISIMIKFPGIIKATTEGASCPFPTLSDSSFKCLQHSCLLDLLEFLSLYHAFSILHLVCRLSTTLV